MPVTSDMGPQSRKSSRTSQVHRKKKKKTFKEIQVVKTLPYEKVSRPTGMSPASNGLQVTVATLLYCISHFPPLVSFSQCAVFPINILTSASPFLPFTFPDVALW